MTAVQRRTAVLCAAAATAAVLAPSSAGAATAKRVQMSDGVITANGAMVTMGTTFTCPAGYQAFLSAQIVEAIGEKFAGGFDTQTRDCTGVKQTVKFFIQAVPAENTRPFEPGPASARVILDAVDPAAFDGGFPTEDPAAEAAPLLPIPPLASNQARADEPPAAPPSIHAEDAGTITLKEKKKQS